jgi:hypothetical protein
MGAPQKSFLLSLILLGQAVCFGAALIFKTTDSFHLAPVQAGYMVLISVAMFSAFIARRFLHLQRTFFLVVISCVTVMVALMGCDLNGMKRWICIGVLRIHAPSLFIPSLLVAFTSYKQIDDAQGWIKGFPILSVSAALIAVAWCSDLSYTVGLSAGILASILSRGRLEHLGYWLPLGASTIILAVLLDEDLSPVIHTEGILSLAWAQSIFVGILSTVSLFLAVVSPFALWKAAPTAEVKGSIIAVSTLFAVVAAFGFTGNWPVPFIGYGAGPILGLALAIGLIYSQTKLKEG